LSNPADKFESGDELKQHVKQARDRAKRKGQHFADDMNRFLLSLRSTGRIINSVRATGVPQLNRLDS
jgi:hypothetical protein